MTKKDLLSLLHRFESIKYQANRILLDIESWNIGLTKVLSSTAGYLAVKQNINAKIIEGRKIIEEYNGVCGTVKKIVEVPDLTPFYLTADSGQGDVCGALRRMITRCDMVTGMIRESITPISSEDADTLKSLREQLRKISLSTGLPEMEYFDKNIEEAMREYERGSFLASALITSRIVVYLLDQLEGGTDLEKVNLLIERGIIPRKRKDVVASMLKACRKARNYFSHDIKVFPQASDSISLLGDCIGLFHYFVQLKAKAE